MTAFDTVLGRLDDDESAILRELDRRFVIAQALMKKVLPNFDAGAKEFADVLFQFFDRVDDFLDSVDDDDDDDDDD
jgi:hypothetical protein